MYFPATADGCAAVPSQVHAVASNNMQYMVNSRGKLKLLSIGRNTDSSDTRSICRRAFDVLWKKLTGRASSDKAYKRSKGDMYIYVSKDQKWALVHLRNAPGQKWRRSFLTLSVLRGKWSDFLRKSNTYVTARATATPILSMLEQTAPFAPSTLRKMRMQILTKIGDKGFPWIQKDISQLSTEITRVLETYQGAQNEMAPGHWEEFLGQGSPWWVRTDPELFRWTQKKRGLIARGRNIQSNVSHWVGKSMKPIEVRKMLSAATWMTGGQRVLFETILGNYFQSNERLLPLHMNMDLALSAIDPASAAEQGGLRQQMLAASIAGSGPFILKVMQQIGAIRGSPEEAYARSCTPTHKWLAENGVSVADAAAATAQDKELDFAGLSKAVFGRVPSLSAEEMAFMRQKLSPLTPLLDKGRMDESSLGSASLAEAHKTVDADGNPVIIKFLRPMYAYYFMCEADFLLTDVWPQLRPTARANFPSATEEQVARMAQQAQQLMMFLIGEFAAEFDYAAEFENMKRGLEIYDQPEDSVVSARPLELRVEPFPYIVQSEGKGIMFSDYIDELEDLPQAEASEKLQKAFALQSTVYRIWLINVLLGNGFFHADLHMGNMMITRDGTLLTVIDYGSGGTLTVIKQCELIDAVLAWARLHTFAELTVGRELYSFSKLLLRGRTSGGHRLGEMRRALKEMKKHEELELDPELTAQLLSEFSQAWGDEECKRAAQIGELVTLVQYQQHGTLNGEQRGRFRELVGISADHPRGDEIADFLILFRELPVLQPTQRRVMVEKTEARADHYLALHAKNRVIALDVLAMLETACEVKGESSVDKEGLVLQVLSYSNKQSFGGFFMNMVQFADQIGSCTHNEILMFGRGIAYVSGVNTRLFDECANDKDCPPSWLKDIIMMPLLKKPKYWRQIVNSRFGKKTNCAGRGK